VDNEELHMDQGRFAQLLAGQVPTLQDFSGFVSVVEKLPVDILWKIASDFPSLNDVLRKVALQNLQEKVRRENVDDVMEAIVASLATRH
jgi:hypothetical protein